MKWLSLAAVFLLSLSFASASWSPYYTIVDTNAPASEVVDAANFAGSMKATLGVAFSGRTADVTTVAPGDGEFLVVFDGKTAWFLWDASADTPSFGMVHETATDYLKAQGFTVLANAPSEKPPQEPKSMVVPRELDSETDVEIVVEEDEVVTQPAAESLAPEPEQPQTEREDAAQNQPVDEPGFFGKIWYWFVDLFN